MAYGSPERINDMNFVFGDRIVICKGRLRGETGKVIGESNLNMAHKIIVYRDKGKTGHKVMGFAPKELTKGEKYGRTPDIIHNRNG